MNTLFRNETTDERQVVTLTSRTTDDQPTSKILLPGDEFEADEEAFAVSFFHAPLNKSDRQTLAERAGAPVPKTRLPDEYALRNGVQQFQ